MTRPYDDKNQTKFYRNMTMNLDKKYSSRKWRASLRFSHEIDSHEVSQFLVLSAHPEPVPRDRLGVSGVPRAQVTDND
jgi:hypothetical protein